MNLWLAMNLRFGVLAFVGLAAVGCGSSGPTTYEVQGTVTLDGAPVAEGDILLLDAGNALAPYAGKIQDGKFSLQSTAGKKRVEIRATRMEKLPAGQVGAMGETEAPVDYIPGRYNANSELTAEVKEGGETVLDFPLVSK